MEDKMFACWYGAPPPLFWRGRRAVRLPNAMKAPHWYNVQVGDTTMMTIAASLPGQK